MKTKKLTRVDTGGFAEVIADEFESDFLAISSACASKKVREE